MTKTGAIRDRISSFLGREFTTRELPKFANLYVALQKMEMRGEIRFVKYIQTGGRPCKVYVEGKLKTERKNAAPDKTIGTPMPEWCKVWPEFFAAPNFVPVRVTKINGWSECHD